MRHLMLIGGSLELPMWLTDGFLVTFLEGEGLMILHFEYVQITDVCHLLFIRRLTLRVGDVTSGWIRACALVFTLRVQWHRGRNDVTG